MATGPTADVPLSTADVPPAAQRVFESDDALGSVLAFLSAATLYVLGATSYALAATKPASLFADALLHPHAAAAAPQPGTGPRQAEVAEVMTLLRGLGVTPPARLVSFLAASAATSWPLLGPALRWRSARGAQIEDVRRGQPRERLQLAVLQGAL